MSDTPLEWPIVVLDVETTGLNPSKGYVVQLGVTIINRYLHKTFRMEWDVRVPNPFVMLRREFWSAKKIHKKTLRQMFLHGDEIEEVVEGLDWLRSMYPDAIIGGQNPYFDYLFMKSMYEYAGKKCPWDYHTLDLSTLGMILLDGKKSLKEIATSLSIDVNKYELHTAHGDSDLTADALISIIKQKVIGEDGR